MEQPAERCFQPGTGAPDRATRDFEAETARLGRFCLNVALEMAFPMITHPYRGVVWLDRGNPLTSPVLGLKLTDAVREIEEMADVRLARQHVMAVIDGIALE